MLNWTITIEENFLFDMHLCHWLGLWRYIRDEIATRYYHTVRYRFCVLTFCLMQEELDSMAKNYPDRFKIYYVLNQVYFYSKN